MDIASLPGARRAAQPAWLAPQLATLVRTVPPGAEWLHELKFDGYRLMSFISRGRARLWTRGRQDWTSRFPAITKTVAALPVKQAIVDGELVATDKHGASSFQALQNALRSNHKSRLVLYVFDLPHCDGFDLTQVPLIDRKRALQEIIKSAGSENSSSTIQFSDHVMEHGAEVYRLACQRSLEGIVSKRADSSYDSVRTRTWVKTKCGQKQEFVIGGFTDPQRSRQSFGSLLLGYYDNDNLVYCGRVGTGFDDAALGSLGKALGKLERATPAFAVPPRRADMRGSRRVHWVDPKLVAEIEFHQWTQDGRLRHPSYQGLREDKDPVEVRREGLHPGDTPASARPTRRRIRRTASPPPAAVKPDTFAGIQLTNPDRVLYPEHEITKAELAEYYVTVAPRMLPHIINRPLTLVRCPRGQQEQCFFQKHLHERVPEFVRGVDIREKPGTGRYIVIDDLAGLVSLVQLGTLEIHPWGCRADNVERPDRMVFDLDPGPGVSWSRVVGAARMTRRVLRAAGLTSFVQTSGGKGLHVVVPLRPKAGWDEVKAFAQAVAQVMRSREPRRYVTVMTKAARSGKIFVDYLRNGRGAMSIAPYSTRARAGAPVAMPLRWEELGLLAGPAAYSVGNPLQAMSLRRVDPWKDYFRVNQTLPSAPA